MQQKKAPSFIPVTVNFIGPRNNNKKKKNEKGREGSREKGNQQNDHPLVEEKKKRKKKLKPEEGHCQDSLSGTRAKAGFPSMSLGRFYDRICWKAKGWERGRKRERERERVEDVQ